MEFAPQDIELYGRKLGNRNTQMTFGSTGIMSYYQILRQAGAQARYLLMNSVAKHWKVGLGELHTQPNKVIHAGSNREMEYGEILSIIEIPQSLPKIREEDLKSPRDFRLIGKNIPRYDIPFKVNGTAQFSLDVKLPEMLFGMIERGRVHGAKPALNNEAEVKAMEGVVSIHYLEYGIGVIAKTVEQAFAAKHKMEITWSK
ncbi:MAG: xanthine dehydrogenase family protein molybdopterin-binding subunit, partial [Bacteroidota bacterium]